MRQRTPNRKPGDRTVASVITGHHAAPERGDCAPWAIAHFSADAERQIWRGGTCVSDSAIDRGMAHTNFGWLVQIRSHAASLNTAHPTRRHVAFSQHASDHLEDHRVSGDR